MDKKLNNATLIQLGKRLAAKLTDEELMEIQDIVNNTEKLLNSSRQLRYDAEATLRRLNNVPIQCLKGMIH